MFNNDVYILTLSAITLSIFIYLIFVFLSNSEVKLEIKKLFVK